MKNPKRIRIITVHRLSADRRAVSAGSADGQDQCARRGKRRKDHMKHVIIFTDCGDTLVDESKQDFIDRERCLVRSAGLIEGARGAGRFEGTWVPGGHGGRRSGRIVRQHRRPVWA